MRSTERRLGARLLQTGYGWSAVIAIVAVVAVASTLVRTTTAAEPPVIDPPRAHALATRGEITIVDIRRPSEWQDTGVPEGAARVSIHSDRGVGGFLEKIARLTGGDKSAPLALICAGGVRSRYAARLLQAEGYSNAFDVREGVLGSDHGPGWIERRLPLEDCPHCARQ